MKLLDRYIGTHVLWGTLLALLVLVMLFTFIAFVDDLDSVGRADYSIWRSLEFMTLTLPRRAFELFPMAALVGSLVGLGVLAGNSELSVIRASGVSTSRISFSVMKAGAILMAVAVLIGEGIAPSAEHLAQERRSVALTKQITLRTSQGLWIRDGSSFVNIREIYPDNRMGDVYIYEFDDQQRLRVATRAGTAQYQGGNWLLEDVSQSIVSEAGVERRAIDRATWDSVFNPDLIDVVSVRPESLSALGLYRFMSYLEANGQSTSRYELALWAKLVGPVATGVMIFLAIPLVLGRLHGVGMGQRILAGIFIGIGFHVIQQASVQIGLVYELVPFMSALMPTAAFLALGVWMMRRLT